MLYTIINSFSPADEDSWNTYCNWRGIQFGRFDSIDGILRPSLIDPIEDEDWEHVVNEDFMLHLITNIKYARKRLAGLGKGDLLAIKFEDHDTEDHAFLGFDIIDGYYNDSLLSNWGNDVDVVNNHIGSNALIKEFKDIEYVYKYLKEKHIEDDHVADCKIVSIYKT